MSLQNDGRPVIVDMFCGSGGESQGIKWSAEKAGLEIDAFAINHWARAIETHKANFPFAEHICRDVADVNPSDLITGGKVALLWASPACTHFSVARGGKPRDDQSRVTPFTVLDWLDKLTVDRLIIENVPEFQSWGPLNERHRPIPEAKGETFVAFIAMIRAMGYTVDWNVLNAADFGAPTTRRRLFIQAVRNESCKSIMWPEPSHIKIGPNRSITEQLPSWVPARDIIDWNYPSESIHSRSRPLAERTMKRIREGLAKFGGKEFLVCMEHGGRVVPASSPVPTITTARGGAIGFAEPFLVEYYGTGQPRPVSSPLPSVTTHDRFALVEPRHNEMDVRFRMLSPKELAAAQSFPKDYLFTGTRQEIVKQIGNAVCPKMAEALTTDYMRELAEAKA
jgi:DNA (cytosine-5)-methyltransferase 1